MNDIVVGVDQSDTARKAAETAARLAACCGLNLHVVMCVPRGKAQEVGVGSDRWHIDPQADAEMFLHDLVRSLPHEKVTTAVVTADPASGIVEEASRVSADMIVVGNRRVQSVGRVLGSVAGDVLKHADCDVLIANTTG